MLSPLTILAGDANTQISKPPTSQVSNLNGGISTITGRLVQVKRRTAARLRVSTNKEQEFVVLWLHGVDSGIHKQCHQRYYLETLYNRFSQPRKSQIKLEKLQKLSGTWVELSEIKIINQGEKHAACSFGSLKSISEPN